MTTFSMHLSAFCMGNHITKSSGWGNSGKTIQNNSIKSRLPKIERWGMFCRTLLLS